MLSSGTYSNVYKGRPTICKYLIYVLSRYPKPTTKIHKYRAGTVYVKGRPVVSVRTCGILQITGPDYSKKFVLKFPLCHFQESRHFLTR
jgi:hypothetical protein